MDRADFKRFGAIMMGMAENYGQSLSAEGVSLRFKLLASFGIDEVEKAAISILTTRKYTSMPTIADFLEHLGGGSVEDRAELEAAKVFSAISDIGPYASVVFDDPVTQAVIANSYGGWPALCETCGGEETPNWFRKNFAKVWAAYSRQGVTLSGHLPGLFEISNGNNGFVDFIPKPKPIGDKAKALAVLDAGKQAKALPLTGKTGLQPVADILPVIPRPGEQNP